MVEKKYDIICFSNCCCDIIFAGLDQLPLSGEEEYCETFEVTSGGGANTPMGLARLGAKTAFLSALGNDVFGRVISDNLTAYGVSKEFLQTGGSTWVSAVLSTKEDRAFASYAGVDLQIDKTLAKKVLQSTKHLHCNVQYAIKYKDLVPMCTEYGVEPSFATAYDPALKLGDLEFLLSQATLFTLNNDEALALTGAATNEDALRILSGCCGYVVITMGEHGCIATKDGKSWHATAAAIPVKTDSTGAGDLFTAGLLYEYLKGSSVEEQMKTASASGSLAVTYHGGMTQAYTQEAVYELRKTIKVKRI